MNRIQEFRKASRSFAAPVMVVPVLLGSLAAYSWNHTFHWLYFMIALVGAVSLHLFSNMINDLWDFRNKTDVFAENMEEAVSTNSQFLTTGKWSERKFAIWTWSLFALALACGIWLSVLTGYMILVYGLTGAAIAYFYVAPPVRFGYRGKGYSELAIVISFGVFPVLGGYYAQTSSFDMRALWLSIPVGLLTTLLLFNHHFLHWRADKEAGKGTLVVVFGEKRALRFSIMLFALSFLFLLIAIFAGALPIYALLALLAGIPTIRIYRGLKEVNPSAAYVPLMAGSQAVSTRVGLIMAAALVIQGIWS